MKLKTVAPSGQGVFDDDQRGLLGIGKSAGHATAGGQDNSRGLIGRIRDSTRAGAHAHTAQPGQLPACRNEFGDSIHAGRQVADGQPVSGRAIVNQIEVTQANASRGEAKDG